MTKIVTIWHNPRCSKSRQTVELVEAQGVVPRIRKYLDDGPSADEIRSVLYMLGLPAIDLMRTKEAAFTEQGLSASDDDETLIAAMAKTPKLIERPVVIADDRAALGRPPEAVLKLF